MVEHADPEKLGLPGPENITDVTHVSLHTTAGSYAEQLAEAERAVLSTALRWLQDQGVSDTDLAGVVDAYADVLDASERNL